MIATSCHLRVRDRQLVIESREGERTQLPLADIGVVIVENPQVTLSAALLSALAQEGTALMSCDSSHLPDGVFAPFGTHSRHTRAARVQAVWSEPFKKRCWQKIVRAKVSSQAEVLRRVGAEDAARRLENLVGKVTSGDTTGVEAQAAQVYWRSLFVNFKRWDGGLDARNGGLNYGYAVLRGALGRAIAGAGLIPAFGLHHAGELNSFNLADDLIEPFRPFVDLLVWGLFLERTGDDPLTREERMRIAQILGESCIMTERYETLLSATQIIARSLVSAGEQKESRRLILPWMGEDDVQGEVYEADGDV